MTDLFIGRYEIRSYRIIMKFNFLLVTEKKSLISVKLFLDM